MGGILGPVHGQSASENVEGQDKLSGTKGVTNHQQVVQKLSHVSEQYLAELQTHW